MNALASLLSASALAAAVLATGCASVDDGKAATEAPSGRVYRTGSNIPVRGETPPATEEERERAAEQIRALQRTGSAGKPKP